MDLKPNVDKSACWSNGTVPVHSNVAESLRGLFIEPLLPCFRDVGVMVTRNNELFVESFSCEHFNSFSTQTNRLFTTCSTLKRKIEELHKLTTYCRYVQWSFIQLPALVTTYASKKRCQVWNTAGFSQEILFGIENRSVYYELVFSIHCPFWPQHAADWSLRPGKSHIGYRSARVTADIPVSARIRIQLAVAQLFYSVWVFYCLTISVSFLVVSIARRLARKQSAKWQVRFR